MRDLAFFYINRSFSSVYNYRKFYCLTYVYIYRAHLNFNHCAIDNFILFILFYMLKWWTLIIFYGIQKVIKDFNYRMIIDTKVT